MSWAGVFNAGASIFQKVQTAIDVTKSPQVQTAWTAAKGLFSKKPQGPMLNPQEISTRKKNLENDLLQSMHKACAQIAPERRQAFAVRTADTVDDVLSDCMYGVDRQSASTSKVLESLFSHAAAKAHQRVEAHLQVELSLERDTIDAPIVRRVLVENPDQPYGPKVERIVVMRSAPPLENLVLRGGGAKGIGNAPAIRALANLGKISELKTIVGTSAGALTAVSLAAGMSAKEYQQLANETDMTALLSSPKSFAKKYPTVQLGASQQGTWVGKLTSLGFEAGNALETLDRSSAKSVATYLNRHWGDIRSKPEWANMTPANQQRLEALKTQNFDTDRTRQMITFGDLHLLHQLEPSKFKELVLTGFNASAGKSVYFSADTHADMSVALAGRISMSIPVFFKPVELLVDGVPQSFVDGGVGSNMPSEVITKGLSDDALGEVNAKTLLMTYDEGGTAYSIMHGSKSKLDGLTGWLSKFFTNTEADNQKIHQAGQSVLPVFHGRLETLSFLASSKQVEDAQSISMLKTLEHIANVMGGGRSDMVVDERAAARLFSVKDQDQFLEKFQMNADPLNVTMCRAILDLRVASA